MSEWNEWILAALGFYCVITLFALQDKVRLQRMDIDILYKLVREKSRSA